MSVYFTSDTHFFHNNIIKYSNRPFLTDADKRALEANGGNWHRGDWKGNGSSNWRITDEAVRTMNDTLIDNINKVVGENDTLWHLGDWAFAPKQEYYRTCKLIRDRILCKNVYLIWGNHDRIEINNIFSGTFGLHQINVNKQKIVLCHYAMAVWDGSHRGTICLYGHSHANAEEWLNKTMPGRRSLDVGVDNAYKLLGDYRPFSFEEIANIMAKRKGFHFDHHGMRSGPTEEELVG